MTSFTDSVALITGSTSGIGLALAKQLVLKGCTVYINGSTGEKCKSTKEEIIKETKVSPSLIKFVAADLQDESYKSVDELCLKLKSELSRLDYLVINAGMMFTSGEGNLNCSRDKVFQVNCLSQFRIVQELLPIVESSEGKIIFTSSSMMFGGCKEKLEQMDKKPFDPKILTERMGSYCCSKLGVALFAKELHERLKEKGSKVKISCFVPGMVTTSLKLSKDERKDVKSTKPLYRDMWTWGMRHRYSSDESGEFFLQVLEETSSKFEILCPYMFPFLLKPLLRSGQSFSHSTLVGSLFWYAENFQKLTTFWKGSNRLYSWPEHPLGLDDVERNKLVKFWETLY